MPLAASAIIAAREAVNLAQHMPIGSQVHDFGHFLTSRANRLGRSIQSSAMSDAIIAVKRAKEGKVFANQTIPGLLAYSGASPQKMVAMHEVNQLIHKMPAPIKDRLFSFDGNLLNTAKMKRTLGYANSADNALLGAQVSTPGVMGAYSYNKARSEGKDQKSSVKSGLRGAAAGLGFSAALYAPRKILGGASALHRNLASDNGYGYDLVHAAAKKAKASLDRPKWMNYSHLVYKTPEQNAKGAGRHITNATQKVLGIKRAKSFDVKSGEYNYNETAPTAIEKVRKWVDNVPKTFGMK